MFIDQYKGSSPSGTAIRSFYGLNRTRRGSGGEFEDMLNMGTLEYPCAAPRGTRKKVAGTETEIDAAAAPDSTNTDSVTGLTGISGGAFYYNGAKKSGNAELTQGLRWEIIRMGNLYVMNGYDPANSCSYLYYYNVDTDKFGEGGSAKTMKDLIVASGNDENGSYLATFRYGFDSVYSYTASDGEGRQIKNSDFFDAYGNPVIHPPNIFERVFDIGDEVSISGFPSYDENFGQVWTYIGTTGTVVPQSQDHSGNNTVDTDLVSDMDEIGKWDIADARVKSFEVRKSSLEGTDIYVHKVYFELRNKDGEELTFSDMVSDTASVYCSGVTVKRRSRVFDHICAHNNRLWGTVPTGNMIYASSSADIFDFTSESVNSMFAASLPSDTPGSFTGLAEYGSELIAFKEDSISVVYGSGVRNYGISVIPGTGCIASGSIAATPSGLIFLGYKGFYIFTGSVPVCISQKLNAEYTSASAGFDGNIYYASAVRGGGTRELLTYDLRFGVWHIQDGFEAAAMFRFRSGFYIAGADGIYKTDAEDGEEPEWSFTSVRMYGGAAGSRAVSEIWIDADISAGAHFEVETSAGNGGFVKHTSFRGSGRDVFRCPVRAEAGNGFRFRISGSGKAVFYEIELRSTESGRRYKDPETSRQLAGKIYGGTDIY